MYLGTVKLYCLIKIPREIFGRHTLIAALDITQHDLR